MPNALERRHNPRTIRLPNRSSIPWACLVVIAGQPLALSPDSPSFNPYDTPANSVPYRSAGQAPVQIAPQVLARSHGTPSFNPSFNWYRSAAKQLPDPLGLRSFTLAKNSTSGPSLGLDVEPLPLISN